MSGEEAYLGAGPATDTPAAQVEQPVKVRRLEPGELAALAKMNEPRYYRADSDGSVFEATAPPEAPDTPAAG